MGRRILACLLIIITFTLSACSNNNNVKKIEGKDKKCDSDNLGPEGIITYDEEVYKNIRDYILNQNCEIDISKGNDFRAFKLLDSSLKDKEIILTGEIHGISANTALEIMFLKYLNQNYGVKYYLCECPYSYAYFLNEYLKNGDEALLLKLFENTHSFLSGTNENIEKWKRIYEFNKSLPDKDKIEVVCIDLEHIPWNAISYLYTLLPNHAPSDKIKPYIEKIKEFYNNRFNLDDDIMNFSMELKNDIENNETEYKKYLGDNFFDFKMTNENITYGFELHNKNSSTIHDFNTYRDEIMYKNFISIYNHLPKGKYYGQFGRNHIYQNQQMGIEWFASLFNKKQSPLSNKILSITYAYKDCQMLTETKPALPYSSLDSEDKLFADVMDKNCVLIKLNGDKSPFNDKILPQDEVFYNGRIPNKGATTDYFQYIVIIQNSKASTLYKK